MSLTSPLWKIKARLHYVHWNFYKTFFTSLVCAYVLYFMSALYQSLHIHTLSKCKRCRRLALIWRKESRGRNWLSVSWRQEGARQREERMIQGGELGKQFPAPRAERASPFVEVGHRVLYGEGETGCIHQLGGDWKERPRRKGFCKVRIFASVIRHEITLKLMLVADSGLDEMCPALTKGPLCLAKL